MRASWAKFCGCSKYELMFLCLFCCRYFAYTYFCVLFCIRSVDWTLMTTFLFTAPWKWDCTSDRLLPRKREAPRVFASIILILTQRSYSAAVVRFSNGRGTRGAGRKKSPSACSNVHVSFQRALLHVRDVRLFLCRWHLRERNSTPTQRCCHPEYRWRMCPCALYLKYMLT